MLKFHPHKVFSICRDFLEIFVNFDSLSVYHNAESKHSPHTIPGKGILSGDSYAESDPPKILRQNCDKTGASESESKFANISAKLQPNSKKFHHVKTNV